MYDKFKSSLYVEPWIENHGQLIFKLVWSRDKRLQEEIEYHYRETQFAAPTDFRALCLNLLEFDGGRNGRRGNKNVPREKERA